MKIWLTILFSSLASLAWSLTDDAARFASLDGSVIDLAAHEGPVLLVNTASLCAFTPQYGVLQAVHERFGDAGLLVVAVPSNDFRQELEDEDAVAEFCEINFDLTLPITTITPVTGADAHPVFAHLQHEYGAVPRWNFNKFLMRDGALLASWGASVPPDAPSVKRAIEAALE